MTSLLLERPFTAFAVHSGRSVHTGYSCISGSVIPSVCNRRVQLGRAGITEVVFFDGVQFKSMLYQIELYQVQWLRRAREQWFSFDSFTSVSAR